MFGFLKTFLIAQLLRYNCAIEKKFENPKLCVSLEFLVEHLVKLLGHMHSSLKKYFNFYV